MYYSENVECPHCKADNNINFHFFSPEDGDYEEEEVECKCGCIFTVQCDAQVEVEFYVSDPKIVSIPENEENKDEPYVSKDPNQLNLL